MHKPAFNVLLYGNVICCVLSEIKGLVATGRGTCRLCGGRYKHGGMSTHIKSHLRDRKDPSKITDGRFVIKVAGEDNNLFWMYLDVDGNIMLSELDGFLRKEWLDCCGHMSLFCVNNADYNSNSHAGGALSMCRILNNVFRETTEFCHEYDFGNTTALRLTVVAARAPDKSGNQENISILARHDDVTFLCNMCGSKAVHICSICEIWDGGAHCHKCAPKHNCGMESMLPVAQSPRVGMCAYSGKKPDMITC